jgi:hypothetical protein
VRSLAGALARSRVDAIALGLMGEPVLSPDAIARVLDNTSASGAVAEWSVDDVREMRRLTARLGQTTTERLLIDATTVDGGEALLRETSGLLSALPSGAGTRLPHRLPDLHEWCRARTPADVSERPAAPPPLVPHAPPAPRQPPAPREPVVAAPEAPQVPRHAYTAPATDRPAPERPTPVPRPAWLAALHGRSLEYGMRLVVPRTVSEVAWWGTLLHNCIGSFGGAVVGGVSVLIGVERDGRLAYCVELDPARRTIRQFLGDRNRPVPAACAAAVCSALVFEGLLDANDPENAPWIALSFQ